MSERKSEVDSYIDDHIEELIDIENRCVEFSDQHKKELACAMCEDGEDILEWVCTLLTYAEWQQFTADISNAFAGKMPQDKFYSEWDSSFEKARNAMVFDIETRIWNRGCDLLDIPPIDYYDEYMLKRSDF